MDPEGVALGVQGLGPPSPPTFSCVAKITLICNIIFQGANINGMCISAFFPFLNLNNYRMPF